MSIYELMDELEAGELSIEFEGEAITETDIVEMVSEFKLFLDGVTPVDFVAAAEAEAEEDEPS